MNLIGQKEVRRVAQGRGTACIRRRYQKSLEKVASVGQVKCGAGKAAGA